MTPDRYKLQSRCNLHLRPEQNLDPFDLFCSQFRGWVGRSVRLTSDYTWWLDTVEIVFSGNHTFHCALTTENRKKRRVSYIVGRCLDRMWGIVRLCDCVVSWGDELLNVMLWVRGCGNLWVTACELLKDVRFCELCLLSVWATGRLSC